MIARWLTLGALVAGALILPASSGVDAVARVVGVALAVVALAPWEAA